MSAASTSPHYATDIETPAHGSPSWLRILLSTAFIVVALVLYAPPAPAQASDTVQGEPVVIMNADGRLEIFAIAASDNSVWHTWQLSPGDHVWAQWESLGGWVDQIVVERNNDGRLELFARGSDAALYHSWQTSAGSRTWVGWGSMGGAVAWAPRNQAIAVAKNLGGQLEVFVIGTDHAVHNNWQTSPGGAWSGWVGHLGGWADQIAVAGNQDGRLEVFVRGSDRAIHHRSQMSPGGSWYDWGHRGGDIDQISVAKNYWGELEIFSIGIDNAIWHNWQVSPGNGTWSGWQSLGGWLDRISSVQLPDGRLEIFARGSDSSLWHNWQLSPSGGWSGWNYEGGSINQPVVASNWDGRLEVFTRGSDGLIYHKRHNCVGCSWSDWASLGAPRVCFNNGRPLLTCGEIELGRRVFGDRIDYSQVRVYPAQLAPQSNIAVTPNGNINWPLDDGDFSNGFRGDIGNYCSALVSGNSELCLFIHEMTHVWQWQNGWNETFGGLVLEKVLGNPPYDYQYDPNKPFICNSIEQQGQIAVGIFYGIHPNNIPSNNVARSALPRDPGVCGVQPGPAPTPPAARLYWSSAGPIAGKFCTQISEPVDPHTWNDNYLCADRDIGLRWSYAGPIPAMVNVQWFEPADPDTWNDNYLAAPIDYGYRWSFAGPIAGKQCVQILETADPNTWNDNYVCW